MAYANVSIHFRLKKDVASAKGFPIYCRIVYQRIKAELFTGEYCPEDRWNEAAEIPIRNPRLVEYLAHIQESIRQAKRQLDMEGKAVSAKILKDIFRGKDSAGVAEPEKVRLVDYFAQYIGKITKQKGQYTPGTVQHYHTTLLHVRNFLAKNRNPDVRFALVDGKFVKDFDHYLTTTPTEQTGQPMGRNTANKYHTKLKTVLLNAVREKELAENPYAELKLKNRAVKRDHLTAEELQRLRLLSLSNLGLDKVRDIFLFSCYTGLRFTDGQDLRAQHIQQDQDGAYWIHIDQKKTKEPLSIPLFDPAKEIYLKYDHLREVTGRVLPSFVNQKVNTYLKILADLANISKKLTHHVARHTFATTVLMENDVPLEAVQAYLGHNSIKTTAIYARMTNKYKMNIANQLNEKLKL